MVKNRIKRRFVHGNILNTIPRQSDLRVQLNKALSKADTRHDIPLSNQHVVSLTSILNIVYGENIVIGRDDTYSDYPPNSDIFTTAIHFQVDSYQLNQGVGGLRLIDGDPFNALSGPIPKHSSIPYFMQRLETGIELIREGETKVVVVSDNVSAGAVDRAILKNQSQIFLRNVNPPPPARQNIEETVTLSSIVDMAGKSVPPNWAELFHAWWDNCVGEQVNSFNINLTAIGAVNMDDTGLTITRNRGNQITQGTHGSLQVGIVIGGTTVNILYDLNQRSLEQSIVRDTRGTVGGFIFVSGKNIAKVFFEEYNNVLHGGTDRIAPRSQHLLDMVVNAVRDSTHISIETATRDVTAIFTTLGGFDNFPLIGAYFIVGKLIGDLLCPLCCDDKWYTLTNDNLMIARCLLLSKRALFYKKNKLFTGFYFFVPQEQPDVVDREVQAFQRESNAQVAELERVVTRARAQAEVLLAQAQAAETQAQAQALQADAQAAETQAQAAEAETVRVRTRSQTAALAYQAQRNQELGIKIEEGKISIRILELLGEKKINYISDTVNRHITLYRQKNKNDKVANEIKIANMHKEYCEQEIKKTISQFSENEIPENQIGQRTREAINMIQRTSMLNINNKQHRLFLQRLVNRLVRDLGVNFLSGGATKINITVKWKKEVFDNIPVDLSEPVSELKVQLFSLTGVAHEKQKVIMDGKTLKDKESLESYGVKQGSVLQMIGNASETWVKPDMKVKFVDDLPASEQATDNSQYPSEDVLKICGGYANVVIQVFESNINKIEEILKGNNEKRNFIFGVGNQPIIGVGNQPIIGVRHEAKKFIESLKSFLEKVIKKIESKDELFMLQIFGDVISHLEDILSITIPIISQPNDNIVIPFCTDYNKVSHVCLLLGINIEDFNIEGEGFEKQFDNFKELFPNDPERILPIADIPTIVKNLITSILNKTIPPEALRDIYGLLKGEDLETILSSNKDNINNLYYNVIPEVLGIMHSYGVFTEAEEVEFYIIQAIVGNENPNQASNEHAIITKSIYSLYQNITVLYGIYVYDAEILKTFIENIKLKNNMIQYDGGFNSLQTIMDYRSDVEFETMVKDTTTYVSLNQFMQQQEQKIKELEQSDKTMLDTERLHALGLNKINEREQLTRLQTAGSKGGKNNRISNPKHNTKYRKNYKKFVSKYIIKKKKNNKKNNKNNKKNNNKKKNNKNRTKKNKRLTKSKPNSKRNNKTLKNKKGKSKSSNHKSKYNKKTKTNYYNFYKHNKTLKH
jgi:hypothetical protein